MIPEQSIKDLVAEVARAKAVLDPGGIHHGIEDAARNAAQVITAQASIIVRLKAGAHAVESEPRNKPPAPAPAPQRRDQLCVCGHPRSLHDEGWDAAGCMAASCPKGCSRFSDSGLRA